MRPTRAYIHRRHLLANLAAVRDGLAPETAICAAVKADAYGHSAALVAPWLVAAGVEALGVATVEEGLALRRLGVRVPLYLLGTLQIDEWKDALDADLDLFVWSRDTIEAVAALARGRATPLRVHLKVDTGMGRVGCRPEDAEDLAKAIVHALPLEFTGVATHLASSDGPGPLLPDVQLERFAGVLSALRSRGWTPRYVHAANSGGIASWPASQFNLVRPGISLYGYPPPGSAGAERFHPVMELVSRVGYVKTVPAGTPLSYGSRYTTSQTTDVATVPVGYADGYRRGFTNRAPLIIGGRRFTVSGTVCMDQLMVDLGPNSGIRAGDPVVLWGPTGEGAPPPRADELATLVDTISYELLCGVSARVPRLPVER